MVKKIKKTEMQQSATLPIQPFTGPKQQIFGQQQQRSAQAKQQVAQTNKEMAASSSIHIIPNSKTGGATVVQGDHTYTLDRAQFEILQTPGIEATAAPGKPNSEITGPAGEIMQRRELAKTPLAAQARAAQSPELAGLKDVSGLPPVETDYSTMGAIKAGLVRAAPGAAGGFTGGVAVGVGAGIVGGGVASVITVPVGAAVGTIGGAVSGFISGYLSSGKKQMQQDVAVSAGEVRNSRATMDIITAGLDAGTISKQDAVKAWNQEYREIAYKESVLKKISDEGPFTVDSGVGLALVETRDWRDNEQYYYQEFLRAYSNPDPTRIIGRDARNTLNNYQEVTE